MGPNEILRWYILEHGLLMVLNEAHDGVAGGHYEGRASVCKILQAGLRWPTLHVDTQDYCHRCDAIQRTRNMLR